MKVKIVKSVAESEVVEVELNGSATLIRQELPVAYEIVDARLLVMNKRVIEANDRHKKLFKTSPEAYRAVIEIFEVLTGRRAPGPVGPQPEPEVETPPVVAE